MGIKTALSDFFREEKIEYFGAIAYKDCRETSSEIMRREDFLPKSVIMYLVPYYGGEPENLSRYAASRDYHIVIKEINERLTALLKREIGEFSSRGYGDHSPIDERDAALSLGLGVLGDNGLLINEKYGSYVFIGDVVTDIAPEALGAVEPMEHRRCSHCGACRKICPTGCLSGEGECLSAITQKKGELSEYEREIMRKVNTVWGCDECQRVCPHNRSVPITPIRFFLSDRIEYLTPELLSSLSREELRSRAFGWRGRSVLLRNLSIFFENGESTNGMKIRKAKMSDITDIEAVYADARELMRESGNPTQWGGVYPPSALIRADIEEDSLYIAEDADGILAVFYYSEREEECYGEIDGEWLSDEPYAVIHRIAISKKARGRGVAGRCFDYCFSMCPNLRIDTHEDNHPMQRALVKNGFSLCGRIRIERPSCDGDSGIRLAYHKIKSLEM